MRLRERRPQAPSGAPSAAGPMIDIRGVSQTYPGRDGTDVLALDNVSISLEEGEFLALVGPSGCGKTTLLNVISGLVSNYSGQALVRGEKPRAGSPHVGYLFARDSLMPWRTIQQNAELAMELKGWDRTTRRNQAREMLTQVGLAGYEDSYPAQLSQGMRQRAAIVRTLAPRPDLVLLDEPFSALDSQTKMQLQDSFGRLWQESKATVVLITHDLGEAVGLADRVAVMTRRPGQIKGVFESDLPKPRSMFDLQSDARFHAIHDKIWQSLKEEVMVP